MSKLCPVDTMIAADQRPSEGASYEQYQPPATTEKTLPIEGKEKQLQTVVSVAHLLVRYMILMHEDQQFQKRLYLHEQKESYLLSKKAVSQQYNSALCTAVGCIGVAAIASFGLTLQLSPHFREVMGSAVNTSRGAVPFANRALEYFLGSFTDASVAPALESIAPSVISNATIASQMSSAASGAFQASNSQLTNEAHLSKSHCDDARSRDQAVKEQLRQIESLYEKCLEMSRSAVPR